MVSRDLLRGSLDLMILSTLTDGERYGYQILTTLRDSTNGRVQVQAGTLYPLLHKLERTGCVTSRWEAHSKRDRKWYRLTDRGRARLNDDAREWLDFAACVRGMLQPVLDGLRDKPGSTEPA